MVRLRLPYGKCKTLSLLVLENILGNKFKSSLNTIGVDRISSGEKG